jgi:quinohemoprotein ethanol dehydrogenase
LLVFKLGGKETLPAHVPQPVARRAPQKPRVAEAVLVQGEELYGTYCISCHGDRARGGVKDLRFMTDETRAAFADIVLRGSREKDGMASFGDVLAAEQAEAIKNYLQARAAEDYEIYGE